VADSDTSPCPNCKRLQKRIYALEHQIADLQQQIAELKKYVFGRHQQKEGPARKPGPLFGHRGWFRRKPKTVDQTEEVSLKACPDCGSRDLSKCAEIQEHLQEDIVLPVPQTTLYRKQVYWCKRCRKKVTGRGKDEMPGSYIGPQAKSIADFLRYRVKVTQRDITRILKGLFGLSVTMGAVQGFHTQTRVRAEPLHAQLQKKIKQEPVIHADETSAPINGTLGWTWLFASPRIALYHIHPSRGGKVVQAVLGTTYNGTLVSDFLSVYNNSITAKAKQKCLVHLQRELDKMRTRFPAPHPVDTYARRLGDFFQEARAFYNAYHQGKITRPQLRTQAGRFKKELPSFVLLKDPQPHIRRLSKRLAKHPHELFTFLEDPDRVRPDNNFAERLIRPCVIFRKLTGGFRTSTGTDNLNVLMSLQQTAHLNGKDPLRLFHNILTQPKLKLDWCLSP